MTQWKKASTCWYIFFIFVSTCMYVLYVLRNRYGDQKLTSSVFLNQFSTLDFELGLLIGWPSSSMDPLQCWNWTGLCCCSCFFPDPLQNVNAENQTKILKLMWQVLPTESFPLPIPSFYFFSSDKVCVQSLTYIRHKVIVNTKSYPPVLYTFINL